MQLSIISKMEAMSLGKLNRFSVTLKLHIHPALPQQATTIANIMLAKELIEPVEAMLILAQSTLLKSLYIQKFLPVGPTAEEIL